MASLRQDLRIDAHESANVRPTNSATSTVWS